MRAQGRGHPPVSPWRRMGASYGKPKGGGMPGLTDTRLAWFIVPALLGCSIATGVVALGDMPLVARMAASDLHVRGCQGDPALPQAIADDARHETRTISGWTVHVSRDLLATNAEATNLALKLLANQLEGIVRVAPPAAVAELRKVSLWMSPEYPHTPPTAEYHPDAGWLREHGRDPAMARGVEFTNVRIFESETRRMPVFVLHELAHAYHDRVLGNDHAGIRMAYEKARAGGKYDRVKRRDADGRETIDRAYAMTNPQEYFAETTEAYFGTNDFFPFTRAELKRHDPAMFALLRKVWNPTRK